MKINLSKIPIFLFACMLTLLVLVFFVPSNFTSIILAAIIIMFFIPAPLEDEISILFFSVNFIAALNESVSQIPLISILEVAFILKCILSQRFRLKWTQAVCLVAVFAISLTSCLALRYSPIKSVMFVVNFLIMLSAFAYSTSITEEDKQITLKKCYWAFIVGLVSALIISLTKISVSSVTYYNRFIGLWTDPNFIGLFATLGIAMLIILAEGRTQRYLLYSPLIMFLLFCGYLTFSRTFVLAAFVIIAFLIAVLMWNKNVHALWKVFSIVAVIVLAVLVYKYYLSGIIAARGVLEEAGRDATNGRLDDIQVAWHTYTSSTTHRLLGIGQITSHSTPLDLFFKFGPICAVFAVWLIIDQFVELRRHKRANDLNMIPLCRMIFIILAVYAAALPMLEDDLMYLLLGSIPLCFSKKFLPHRTNLRRIYEDRSDKSNIVLPFTPKNLFWRDRNHRQKVYGSHRSV